MALQRSPLAPAAFPAMPPVSGARMVTAACGVRYKNRTDVCLIELAPGSAMAGVLTRSLTASAPVLWCRRALKGGRGRAIVINSGHANAFTGSVGLASVERVVASTAKLLGAKKTEVYVASTGVIGERLADERITEALTGLAGALDADRWQAAAEAIMTTDTYPKGAARTAEIGGMPVRINGIAKGSGMIAPDMATMLAFVVTDAKIPAKVLQTLLARGADTSFNAITVDGDTSTSDTLLLAATGQAKHKRVTGPGDPHLKGFRAALDDLLLDLAHQVVRDGEGARKFVRIAVSGAASKRAARRIGMSIANSPLVKTAIAGEDANWGRVVMAVGKAGEPADRDKLEIYFGGIRVAHKGARDPAYKEETVAAVMRKPEIQIKVGIGLGKGRDRVLTCDLTKEYVAINGDYRS